MQGQERPGEEGGQRGDSNMAMVALIVGCCGLCLLSIVLAIYGSLVYVVLTAEAAGGVACASESNIWVYCLTMIIVLPILSCLFSVLSTLSDAKYLMAIPNAIGAIVAVWGILLWVNMSKDCEAYYTEEFPTLLFLFYVLVIITVISMAAALCSFCCMVMILAASVSSSGSTARFDDIDETAEPFNPFQQQNAGYQGVPQNATADDSKLETEEYV